MLPPDHKKPSPTKASDTTPEHIVRAEMHDEAGPAAPPAAVTAPPSLSAMLHALRRCWYWAVPLAAVAAAVSALAAWYVYPGNYNAVVAFRILVRAQHGSQEDEGHFANVQNAQFSKLTSQEVLADAIQQSAVADKYGVSYTPQTLARKLTRNFNAGPEIMYVNLTGDNPEALAAILNALGQVYPDKVAAEEEGRVRERIGQLRRRLDISGDRRDPGRALTLAEQLSDKRHELQKAEREHKLDDLATMQNKHQNAANTRATIERELQARKAELRGAEGELSAGTISSLSGTVEEVDLEEALSRNAEYKEAQDVVRDLKKSIAAAESRFRGAALRDRTKDDRASLAEWEDYQKQIARSVGRKLKSKLDSQREQERKKGAADVRARVSRLKNQVDELEKALVDWQKKEEESRVGAQKIPPEVEALRDQVKQLEKESNEVGGQVASLEGSLPLPRRVTLHGGEALVPGERETSKSQKIALAVGMLVFMGVIAGLCLLEATGKRVYSSSDVLQGLGMRIIGTLPRLPSGARSKSTSAQALGGLDSRYGMTEAIDAIRTVIMHSPRNDGARVILVTSAIGGEGKTTLASHLAASLARAWRKTLLIDGDLRKPALHGQFDQPLEPGLSEALRGEIEFDDCIKPTMTSRLWLMPAGKVDGHSLQALAQDGLESVFESLKEQYDFIVIDTSPVLLVPDGLLLAHQADTVLMSVMKDKSRIPAVYAAQQKLEALGVRVLGSVLIGEKTEAYGHAVPYPRS